MKCKKGEKGLLSLEACIVVTIFIFLMLFLYSYFIVFEARNELAHVMLSTCNSLALDAYGSSETTLSPNYTVRSFFTSLYGISGEFESPFVSYKAWYRSANFFNDGKSEGNFDGTIYASDEALKEADRIAQEKADENGLINLETRDAYGKLSGAVNEQIDIVIRERFVAYLAGGNSEHAERILKRLHIVGGLNGLDFSHSYVSDGKLYIVLKYKLEYEFNTFGLGELECEQTACSKLWAT